MPAASAAPCQQQQHQPPHPDKLVLVLIDGVGDVTLPAFGDATPLQVAHTPNLDCIAGLGPVWVLCCVTATKTPLQLEPSLWQSVGLMMNGTDCRRLGSSFREALVVGRSLHPVPALPVHDLPPAAAALFALFTPNNHAGTCTPNPPNNTPHSRWPGGPGGRR
jgi:hypothetical protein